MNDASQARQRQIRRLLCWCPVACSRAAADLAPLHFRHSRGKGTCLFGAWGQKGSHHRHWSPRSPTPILRTAAESTGYFSTGGRLGVCVVIKLLLEGDSAVLIFCQSPIQESWRRLQTGKVDCLQRECSLVRKSTFYTHPLPRGIRVSTPVSPVLTEARYTKYHLKGERRWLGDVVSWAIQGLSQPVLWTSVLLAFLTEHKQYLLVPWYLSSGVLM